MVGTVPFYTEEKQDTGRAKGILHTVTLLVGFGADF